MDYDILFMHSMYLISNFMATVCAFGLLFFLINCMIAGLRSESVWRALLWEERGGTSTVPSLSIDLVMRVSHSQDSLPIPRYSK